jgi:DNA (cytosine-5)-methyltransferase 1
MGSLAEVIGVHLPTPTVGNATGTNERRGGARSDEKLLPGVVLEFLPTPNASDGSGGGQHPSKRVGHSRQLIDFVLLLTGEPTPPLFDVGNV